MRWDVHAELDREDGVTVMLRELPASAGGGLYVRYWGGDAVIALDPRLEGPERLEVLTHELLHHRAGGCAGGRQRALWRAVRAREEHRVRRATAALLVPVDALVAFCDQQADLGEGVGPDEVMQEFDVTRRVAEQSLENLARHERGR